MEATDTVSENLKQTPKFNFLTKLKKTKAVREASG